VSGDQRAETDLVEALAEIIESLAPIPRLPASDGEKSSTR
jgi:hypothetical protein